MNTFEKTAELAGRILIATLFLVARGADDRSLDARRGRLTAVADPMLVR